jgi:uncharacterized small protein (DUF1192 family)
MSPKNSEKEKSSSHKLDEILSSVKELRNHIENLDYRISRLEGHIDKKLSISTKPGIVKPTG